MLLSTTLRALRCRHEFASAWQRYLLNVDALY